MNRRRFFGALAGASAGAAVVKAAQVKVDPLNRLWLRQCADGKWRRIGNFDICWTGWKEAMNTHLLCGQWVAVYMGPGQLIRTRPHWRDDFGSYGGVYSSTPGAVDFFRKGDSFDISWQEGQQVVTGLSSLAEKQGACLQAYHRLIRFLEEETTR